MPVERLAPAKINLALHVVGRRPDGYHELDTLAVFGDFGDRISVRDAPRLSLSVAGPMAGHAPGGAENLVLKAAEALRAHASYPGGAAILLEKNLPAGAGLGGGSADAAAALDALNLLWKIDASHSDLRSLGRSLGADVPMCAAGRALRARGTGERIDPVAGWPALPLVMVWPGQPVSTAAAYAALARRDNPPLPEAPSAPTVRELAEWLANCRNDFEPSVLTLVPEVGAALRTLRSSRGCLLARMSGSGSGCFGIFGTMHQADRARTSLSAAHPDWWSATTLAR